VLALRVADPGSAADAAAVVADLAAGDDPFVDGAAGEVRLPVADPGAAAEALRRLDARELRIAAIELQEPSLDDVFLSLTGRRADDEPGADDAREPMAA
jgi:Domain of unknown function (DUF4162)